ncbi:MAG: pilus assembly protein PilM [Planctomycetaceae bacterium]|jgi:type IV pilus assembly protein PilM|nr:pilus assembly protein PilM [Planctomycetaceae bacterium]
MASNQAVWGIDIGNTSLKAMRCRMADTPGKIEALACDFIEHSKVLSQPGTDVAEVVAETLQTFLSRNVTKGDRIAVSVAGQSTISRFLPLPPVDPKKIPDVIRYESKQWLPFDLNDVVFDFQPLTKLHQDDENETLVDATVGMFAIKKDVAMKAITPYLNRSVDIDSIQSSPIALYNFVAFDQLPPPAETSDDDDQRESLITLCIGTDATDVVITNGETIWTRNLPLGGNSFTKALTRELQLTFSKAEYLKRNITVSKDVEEQKRVITAMRPVFNDMVSEVNRSLEYYQTLNRKAKFRKIIALGNAAKLPGLRQFVAQNLGYEVARLNRFSNLVGTEVTETQLFKDNLHSFAVCYGLAIQQLGVSSLKTNLIPREVLFDRIVREKKPWMLAAAAALLLGITIQFAGVTSAHNSVVNDAYKDAEKKVVEATKYATDMKSKTTKAVSDFNAVNEIGKKLTSNVEGRITWLELLRAINAALPQSQSMGQVAKPMTSDGFARVNRVFIKSIEAISVTSLSEWFAPLKTDKRYYPDDEELESLVGTSGSTGMTPSGSASGKTATATPATPAEEETEGNLNAPSVRTPRNLTEAERFDLVTGPGGGGSSGISSTPKTSAPKTTTTTTGAKPSGSTTSSGTSATRSTSSMTSGSSMMSGGSAAAKVVQIIGHHYHNPKDQNEFADDGGEAYLRKTFLRNLKFIEVDLPPTLEEQEKGIPTKRVKMSELGISYPVLLYVSNVVEEKMINPDLLLGGELPPGVFVDPMSLSELNSGQQGGGSGTGGTRTGRTTGGRSNPAGGGTGTMGGTGFAQQGTTPLNYYAQQMGVMEPVITVRRFDFVIQFAWEETPPSQRKQKEEDAVTSTPATK